MDRAGNRGRAVHGEQVSPSRFFFSLNQPPTAEIDHRWSISAVLLGSRRSAYRSVGGSVCTARYGALPLGKANLAFIEHMSSIVESVHRYEPVR
ncbi:hypothetical protein BHM03_00053519 [Ensete ventricosum]|nr:hypothetical protein BHM03_00053519 [Ensete ventricosum]